MKYEAEPWLPVSALMQCHRAFDPYFYNMAIDWAMDLIRQGIETENTLILISFSKPVDSLEISSYVAGALRDLGLAEKTGDDAILTIAHYHIDQVIHDRDIRINLHALAKFAVANNYNYGLYDFFLLHHGWEALEDIGVNFYYGEATLKNIESIVKREGMKWIEQHIHAGLNYFTNNSSTST